MKLIELLLLGAVMFTALGANADVEDPVSSSTLDLRKNFHLITYKCEPESGETPETTPQAPPLDIDDPGTPGCNTWEINIVANGDLVKGQNSWQLPLFDINYGVGDNLQLKYEVPYINQQTETGTVSTLGESIVGVKYMFYDNEATDLQMAIYPQITYVDTNSEAVRRGVVTPGSITTLPFLLSRKLGEISNGDVAMTFDLSYNSSTKRDTTDFIGADIGIGAPLSRKIAVISELETDQGVIPDQDGTRQQLVKFNVGFIGTINKNLLVLGSAGHGLYSSDRLAHTYALLGLRFLEGGVRK